MTTKQNRTEKLRNQSNNCIKLFEQGIDIGREKMLKEVMEIINNCRKKNLTKIGWYLSEEELKAKLKEAEK